VHDVIDFTGKQRVSKCRNKNTWALWGKQVAGWVVTLGFDKHELAFKASGCKNLVGNHARLGFG
jgi:hypothetical protein